MVPTSQEYDVRMEKSTVPDDEKIVISGMSGLFPQSRHVQDLCDILYNKVYLDIHMYIIVRTFFLELSNILKKSGAETWSFR